MKKLQLPIRDHPRPYKLQWFSDYDEVCVSKQAPVQFSIGRYEDELLCDIVPMQATHIILGRPWQYIVFLQVDTNPIEDEPVFHKPQT